jgi:hypothetical protein
MCSLNVHVNCTTAYSTFHSNEWISIKCGIQGLKQDISGRSRFWYEIWGFRGLLGWIHTTSLDEFDFGAYQLKNTASDYETQI